MLLASCTGILLRLVVIFLLLFMVQGNLVYEVPNGYKLKITPGKSGFESFL